MSSNITIERNPDAARLSELGVATWPTWSKEVGISFWVWRAGNGLQTRRRMRNHAGRRQCVGQLRYGRFSGFPCRIVLQLGGQKSAE